MERADFDRLRDAARRQGRKPGISAAATLDRLKLELGFETDSALAGFLGRDISALRRMRLEDSLPVEDVMLCAMQWGLSLDRILFGAVPDAAGVREVA